MVLLPPLNMLEFDKCMYMYTSIVCARIAQHGERAQVTHSL